jgi:hypothetical protein
MIVINAMEHAPVRVGWLVDISNPDGGFPQPKAEAWQLTPASIWDVAGGGMIPGRPHPFLLNMTTIHRSAVR